MMSKGIHLNEGESEKVNKGEAGEGSNLERKLNTIFIPANLNVPAVGLWPGMIVIMSETAMSTTAHTMGPLWTSWPIRSPVDLMSD